MILESSNSTYLLFVCFFFLNIIISVYGWDIVWTLGGSRLAHKVGHRSKHSPPFWRLSPAIYIIWRMAHGLWTMDYGLWTADYKRTDFKKNSSHKLGATICYWLLYNRESVDVCSCEKYLEKWKREISLESSSGFGGRYQYQKSAPTKYWLKLGLWGGFYKFFFIYYYAYPV